MDNNGQYWEPTIWFIHCAGCALESVVLDTNSRQTNLQSTLTHDIATTMITPTISYASALSSMITDTDVPRGYLNVRTSYVVHERSETPVRLSIWTREDNEPAYGARPLHLLGERSPILVPRMTRNEKYELAFWDKLDSRYTVDSSAAQAYMRARTYDEVEATAYVIAGFGVRLAGRTLRYIRDNITDAQIRRIVKCVTRGVSRATIKSDIVWNSTPVVAAVHLSAFGHKIAELERERHWARFHREVRIPVREASRVNDCIGNVVAQAGLFGDTQWSKNMGKCLKQLAGYLKRFAECGIAGRIIIYAALTLLLSKIIKIAPWWAIVAILTCGELGWVSQFGADVADIVPRDDDADEYEFCFPPIGAPISDWNNRYDSNGDPCIPPERCQFLDDSLEMRQGSVVAQSGATLTLLAAGLTALIAKKVPLYVKIVNASKFRAGLEDVLRGVEGSFEAFVNFILRCFGSKRMFRFRQELGVLGSFCDSVDRLDVEVRAKGCEIDEAMFQRFAGLIGRGEELLTSWPRDSPEWRKVKHSMGVLTRLSCDYPAHFNSAKARIEPIGLMLSGAPGLGKTTLLKAITKIIAKYEFPDEPYDMSKHMFQKPTGQYYEGYKGQTVFCLDDVFTKQPVAGETDGDAETIVRLINQWPLALNMANCALKGRFFMTSPYVIATSNLNRLDGLKKAVIDENAILRRFPLWYRVELVPGAKIGPDCDPDATWRFRESDFAGTGNATRVITFTELMRELFAERRRRLAYAKSDVVSDSYVSRLVDDVRDAERATDVVGELRQVVPQSGRALRIGLGACAAAIGAKVIVGALSRAAVGAVDRVRGAVFKRVPAILDKMVVVSTKTAAKVAAIAVLFVLAIKGIKSVVKGFFGLMSRPFKSSLKPDDVKSHAPIVAQAGAKDEVVELVQRNMFTVYCNSVRLGFALGLDDMTLVMPGHFVEESQRRKFPLIAVGRRGHQIILGFAERIDEARDMAYFRVKTMCRDLTKSHIASDMKETNLLLVRPTSVERCSTTLQPKNVSYNGSPEFRPTKRTMHVHTARTDYGDCGAVVMALTGKSGRRIYGFHTAADLSERKYTGCFTTFGGSVVAQSNSDFCGHELIGKIDRPVHNGGDTRLEPTPYAGIMGAVKTAPSAKRPANGVDPMLKAISGYKREWGQVPPEMRSCVAAVVAEVFEAIKGYDLSPVTLWEAAAGIAGEPYCKGLARGKSPGYPFIERYHDKKAMLGSEGPYTQGPAYEELVAAVRALEATYKAGGQGAIYRDSLKDEPRKLEKVMNCQTRMISGCPVELAVLGRMQTLRFTSALMQTRHEHGIMPGFNPYGVEANQLFHRLAFVNKKRNATAGDYKEFDKTQHPEIMGDLWGSISRRLVQHGCDPMILAGLGRDTFHAMHLGGNSYVSDTIYRVDGTLPSGHWMTSFLNSLYNAVVIRYCWVKYRGSVASVYDFCKHVAAVYYGDDFLMSVDDEHQAFGLDVLQKYVADLGMIMTDEDGNFGGMPNKSLFDCSFLCRRFRVADSGVVWMPLDTDSIDDMYNWKKKSTPIEQHTEAIIRASLMEAAAHPIDVFVKYYKASQEIARHHVFRFPELALPLEQAYDHWKCVHKGHVPIWSSDDEE